LRSEPSGFAENTWPLLALRKNNWDFLTFALVFLIFDSADLTGMIFLRSFITSFVGRPVDKKIASSLQLR
jgi:hypothetical protein